MLPVVLAGAAALFGLYQYNKMKTSAATHPVAQALAAAPPPPAPGQAFATTPVPANNSSGTIAYHPTTIVPGFNAPLRYVAAPPAPSGTTYPPANTVTDPHKADGITFTPRAAAWQAATPTPSNMYYYPADPSVNPDSHADIWAIVAARLGGTPKAKLVDPKNNTSTPISAISVDDMGKLNGIVSFTDWDNALKARKPIMLPLGAYNDVAGPVPFAMGTIGPAR